MYPSSFYKMKNFANPKTMFRSCSNNEEFSTKPITSKLVSCGSRAAGAGAAIGRAVVFGRGASAAGAPAARGRGQGNGEMSGGPNTPKRSFKGEEGKRSENWSGHSSIRSPNSSATRSNSSAYGTPKPSNDGTDKMDTISFNDDEYENTEKDGSSNAVAHHPLNNTWTLWYLENDRSKTWEDMLHEVTSFNTVEGFWSLINHIKPPSDIKLGSDYCLFKKGIRPMWEDTANKLGGRWMINVSKNKSDLDDFWLNTMLCLIGECCDHSDELCGAVVNIRGKSNKISIWTADGNNEVAALDIGHQLRDSLRMEGACVLQYQLHKDSMVKLGSTVKSVYTV